MGDDQSQSSQASTTSLTIPEETKKQFPDLVELILGSESMNADERQYWISILPLMTPEQRTQLTKILTDEREQLKAIDVKYTKAIENIGQEELTKQTTEERRKQRQERTSKEEEAKAAEEQSTEDILGKIEEQA